jgi:diguanylate cyclase (GGDEF)-like protein
LHRPPKYEILNNKKVIKLNVRDVFLQHIESIRQFLKADTVSVYHPNIHASMNKILVGDASYFLPSFLDTESKLIEQQGLHLTFCDDIRVAQHQGNHLVFRLNDNPYIDATEHNYTSISSEQSRRTPIETFDDEGWHWIIISFNNETPDWLNNIEKRCTNSKSPQLSTLFRLLISASLQLKLIDRHMSLLSDPLTQLCSRKVMQSSVARLSKKYSVGLIMLHCIDFQKINKKFGHDHGDKIIIEIAEYLTKITREGDIVGRFGGALFGVAFPVNAQTDVSKLSSKLQDSLQSRQYLEGAIHLTFDIGAAIAKHEECYKSDYDRALSLINLADQALKAAQQEEIPSIIVWQNEDLSLYQPDFQYSGGIFTADTVTDYRNMLLLWDISSIIADKNDFHQLLKSSIHRLAQTFEFQYAGLLVDGDAQDLSLQFSVDELDRIQPITTQNEPLMHELRQLQSEVIAKNVPIDKTFKGSLLLLLPLEVEESTDCFFIVGHTKDFDVTFDTKTLLSGLTKQIGRALRRSRLEEELNNKLTHKNAQLESELVQLKEGLQVSSLVYQSPVMHKLMKYAQRAAMTDTTVLISGESGTGKERLLHTLHQMGPRCQKPLIIVDCGSIPETLIESELFGHVKGAFTGAQQSSTGKILEADGGILVMDEIGELPIQMQSKLLRFVQEKHFTPVGGNKVINVDVKIVAATNRDLAQEVEKGNFRKDLYYRLNVLTLHNPPLRERLEDINLLSNHFLNKFAEQFSVQKKKLSKDALVKMQQYPWPGNIRELENRLMQAMLIGEGNEIDWPLLNIEEISTPMDTKLKVQNSEVNRSQLPTVVPPTDNVFIQTFPPFVANPIKEDTTLDEGLNKQISRTREYIKTLQSVMVKALHEIQNDSNFFNTPFGSWVEDEFVIQVFLANERHVRKASARLCISLSTGRRRIEKLSKLKEQEMVQRPASWPDLIEALQPFAIGKVAFSHGIADLKLITLQVILSSSMPSMSSAANLLGVSEPTFYKLKRELEKSPLNQAPEPA